MASHILDTEIETDFNGGKKHKSLIAWVEEIAQLCKPDRVSLVRRFRRGISGDDPPDGPGRHRDSAQ